MTPAFSTFTEVVVEPFEISEGIFVEPGEYDVDTRGILVNRIQYDNVTETAGINVRLHWIPVAGREVYFVINHNVADPDRDNNFHSTFSDMTAKVNYTFRF